MKDLLLDILREIHRNHGSLRDSNVCDDEVLSVLEDYADALNIPAESYQRENPDYTDPDPFGIQRGAKRLTQTLDKIRNFKPSIGINYIEMAQEAIKRVYGEIEGYEYIFDGVANDKHAIEDRLTDANLHEPCKVFQSMYLLRR